MTTTTPPLPIKRILERLSYDPDTGIFRWRDTRGTPIAGKLTSNGYVRINVDDVPFAAHRLAYYIHCGVWGPELDHIDGDKTNNRISNLEVVTRSENVIRAYRRNGGDMRGIRFRGAGYQVRIKRNYTEIYLGVYRTLDAAKAARDIAETKI